MVYRCRSVDIGWLSGTFDKIISDGGGIGIRIRKNMIPYFGARVYGPYNRKQDKRKHVCLVFPDGTKLTVSYPKYLWEITNKEYLREGYEIHHLDGDETNNELYNLSIVHKKEHMSLHKGEDEIWICAYCGEPFLVDSLKISRRKTEQRRGKSKTGPFCSKRCSGKVNN